MALDERKWKPASSKARGSGCCLRVAVEEDHHAGAHTGGARHGDHVPYAKKTITLELTLETLGTAIICAREKKTIMMELTLETPGTASTCPMRRRPSHWRR